MELFPCSQQSLESQRSVHFAGGTSAGRWQRGPVSVVRGLESLGGPLSCFLRAVHGSLP